MKLIQVAEAAERLGVSRQTLENWGAYGVIKIRKIGKHGNSHWVDADTIDALGDTMVDVENARIQLEKERKDIETMSKETKQMYYDIRHELRLVQASGVKYIAREFYRSIVDMLSDIGVLNIREDKFIKAFLDGRNVSDIAEEYCLTNSRISQILFKACRKIRRSTEIKDRLDEIDTLKEKVAMYERTIEILEKELKERRVHDDVQETHDCVQDGMIKLLETRLVHFDLSVRALNCLKSADVNTVADLVRCHKADLLKFRNFGRKSLGELEDFLASQGLDFGMDVDKIYRDFIMQKRANNNEIKLFNHELNELYEYGN